MKIPERVLYRETKIAAGDLRTTSWSDGSVQFGLFGSALITIHVSREQALAISKNLVDVVAAYDATVDHYHDVCDEPVAGEVQ
jgi:hypothetical protein